MSHGPVMRASRLALGAQLGALVWSVAFTAHAAEPAAVNAAAPTEASASAETPPRTDAASGVSATPTNDPAPPLAALPTTNPDAPVAAPAPGADAGFYGATGTDADSLAGTTYPKLELSGFTDFTFAANVSSKDSPLRKVIQPYSSFSIGNLNLYLSASLAEKWHLLAEVRFLYLPQGNAPFPLASGQQYEPFNASALDYADDGRALTWGGIQVQRVQIDYALHPLLSFRFGQWLTPVGIWNVDHGSPVVIGVYRPYVVGQGIFPERQTGIQASGEWNGDVHTAGYTVTVSNGRGPSDAYADLDNNKAVGGRLYYSNNAFGTLTLGVSAYDGTYASRNKQYDVVKTGSGTPSVVAVSPLTLRYHERSLAADVRFLWRGLLVQGEVLQHEVVYQNDVRPVLNGSLLADYRERGFYALAGYRTPWLGIMPFAMYEGLNFASQAYVAPGNAVSVGLNVRPEANLVLKLQYHVTTLGSNTSDRPYHGVLKRLLAQLAVAF